MSEIIVPKKLIEVAVPLDDINREAAREKSIRHGHPSTLHLWWARRPLAAARAVLFAQMVNAPGWNNPNPTPQQVGMYGNQRKKLFRIMRELVVWENSDNERVLKEAREEIWKSWRETCEANKDHPDAATLFNPDVLPAGHDPFAGGGTIPLEMQRLGLSAYASDLNPVAVMINKAMIELPPKCAGHPSVNPGSKRIASSWKRCHGLSKDIQYYGKWMRDEAFKRIGHLYPQVEITEEMAKDRPDLLQYVGQKLTVIAWLWARTVKSPNPAYSHLDIPLMSSSILSTKRKIWVEPVIRENKSGFDFVVRTTGEPKFKEGTISKKGGLCLYSNSTVDLNYIRNEARLGRMGDKLMAVVCEGEKERVYLSPDACQLPDIMGVESVWKSTLPIPKKHRDFNPPTYGIERFGDLFSKRQAVVLSTFSDLILEVIEQLKQTEEGDSTYCLALSTYLSFVLDKCADRWSSVCGWDRSRDNIRNTFGRQAIRIAWDYAEGNPFSESTGNWMSMLEWVWEVVELLPASGEGFAYQADAQTQTISANKVISTDPPYYDNIMYADISDYFYVWMRRSLRNLYPELFGSMATPKEEELVAAKHRTGSDRAAAEFFLSGMKTAMQNLASQAHPAYPVTIYYAFKQSETKGDGTASTGWETFLEAVIQSGFAITGTLPMRTELKNRMIGLGANALASSIVLVCRKRDADAPMISRREFIKELNREMPKALAKMTGETEEEKNEYKVSAVDLAQSAIGPGMEIFSKYSGILEANGSKMTVHEALVLINKVLSAYLDKDDDEYDADTKFCKAWFELYGWQEGEFGTADTLSRAKGTSVDGLVEAGVVSAKGGKVKLIHFSEYEDNWDATKDSRIPIWEALHHMVKAHQKGGDFKAASIYAQVESMTSAINLLATRLYQMCEQKGWAEDARPYNELSAAWQSVSENAGRAALAPARAPGKKREDGQRTLSGF